MYTSNLDQCALAFPKSSLAIKIWEGQTERASACNKSCTKNPPYQVSKKLMNLFSTQVYYHVHFLFFFLRAGLLSFPKQVDLNISERWVEDERSRICSICDLCRYVLCFSSSASNVGECRILSCTANYSLICSITFSSSYHSCGRSLRYVPFVSMHLGGTVKNRVDLSTKWNGFDVLISPVYLK